MKALLNELRKTKSVRAVFLIVVGWILSPLTFWNDAVVNIPITYLCASVVALFGVNEMKDILKFRSMLKKPAEG